MSQGEVWTIKSLLDWTVGFLQKKGSDSPRLDAEILLAHALGKSRVELYVSYDAVPDDEARGKFRELVRRRGLGEPVAYLVGNKEFYSLRFDVDKRALIPRPETEQLVLEIVEYVKKRANAFGKSGADELASADALRVCEVGVGSGCLSIALAKHVPTARILALDISEDALDVARANAARHSVEDRVEFLRSDLFDALDAASPDFAPPYDVIVSNPPYVSQAEYAALAPSVREFEPALALVGGPTGAELANKLVARAPDYLASGGKLYLELSPTTVEAVASQIEQDACWRDSRVFSDLARAPRYIEATRQ